VDLAVGEVKLYEEGVENQARSMINSQGEALYEFINQFSGNEAELKNAIGKIKVGDTGYVYILDYNGNMLYHPVDASLIGTNMMGRTDANGITFIKDQVDMERELLEKFRVHKKFLG
jgi:signal transduction histidine kinase